MLRTYLLIAFRNFRRHRLYSFINVGCLAVGITISLTVMMYVLHEYSYDLFHKNGKRILV